jgi:hypothetical protein
MVDSTANQTGRVVGLAELGIAEIKLSAATVGKLTFRVGLEEAPDIKVLDAVLAVKVVECSALAQGNREETTPIQAAGLGLAVEQIGTIFRGKLPEALQICVYKRFVRP